MQPENYYGFFVSNSESDIYKFIMNTTYIG